MMILTGRAAAFPSIATYQARSELAGGRLGEGSYLIGVVLWKRGLILKLKRRGRSFWEWVQKQAGSETGLH